MSIDKVQQAGSYGVVFDVSIFPHGIHFHFYWRRASYFKSEENGIHQI